MYKANPPLEHHTLPSSNRVDIPKRNTWTCSKLSTACVLFVGRRMINSITRVVGGNLRVNASFDLVSCELPSF